VEDEMPYVSVYIDADDALEDIYTADLKAEILRRMSKNKNARMNIGDYMIPPLEAHQALEDAASFARKNSRPDLAYKLDEVRHDFIQTKM
jgi:hypothetical protein